jgi:L-ascorbate metabolism protein UlaG (beta-lactamase superfamily)
VSASHLPMITRVWASADTGTVSGPELHFVGHSTVRIDLAGRRVLTDPLLTRGPGPLRRVVPVPDPAVWEGTDVVLISHLHGDHLHLPSLRRLAAGTRIVVPRGAGGWLRSRGFARVDELAPGEVLTDGALRITAVPAVHSGHRWGPRLTHGPHTAAIGHLIEGGGHTVYAAGDTDIYPRMIRLADRGIDAALLPVWGWGPTLGPGHLDPERAAEAAALLRPRTVVPVHWGTLALAGSRALPTPGRSRMGRLLVEPPRRFAAAVRELGLRTQVVITPPGARVVLPVAAP